MANLLWLQGGACWGDASSFLNADGPNACDLVTDFGVKVLWRPSFGMEPGEGLRRMLKDVLDGAIILDVLVFEGAVVEAPNGAGEWHRFAGRPMKDWVADLSRAARHVVAIGGRACFLGEGYRSGAGLPPINVPGRPDHDRVAQIVMGLVGGRGAALALDDLQRSERLVAMPAIESGHRGARLSYEPARRGPMIHSPRNHVLWNRRASRTREAGQTLAPGAALAAAADEALPTGERAERLVETAMALQAQPGTAEHLLGALKLYKTALKLCPPDDALLRARIQARRATALQAVAETGTERLEQARDAYLEVLPVLAAQGEPAEVAEAEMNLGLVLQSLASANKARIVDAMAAYQRSLRTFEAKTYPAEYAILQNNLATCFLSTPVADERSKMRVALAVESFEAGLKAVSPIDYPVEHAMLRDNLAAAPQHASTSHALADNPAAPEVRDEVLSSRAAARTPRRVDVRRRAACVAACLAENGRPPDALPVLGIVLDGHGRRGEDGTVWGGEFLLADHARSQRLACFKPVPMPGAAQTIRQPWRSLYAHLTAEMSWAELTMNFGELEVMQWLDASERGVLDVLIGKDIDTPLSTSCGRLFDAVAAALGLCRELQSYEGEAAARLESIVDRTALEGEGEEFAYPFIFPNLEGADIPYVDPRWMWNALLGDLGLATPPGVIAARFHRGLAKALTEMAVRLKGRGFDTVALSGGCFQNQVLLGETGRRLAAAGFTVVSHAVVPANEGGLALGEATGRLMAAGGRG